MKKCSECKIEKEASFFHKSKRHYTGLSQLCKPCYSKRYKAYYSRPDKRDKRIKTVEAYQARPGFKEKRRLYDAEYRLRTVERRKQWREASKERERERIFQQKYGITISDYDDMFDQQNGICAICGNPPSNIRLSVDHCHETGKVRGLLCFPCNRAIGSFKDDIRILLSAIEYLSKTQAPTEEYEATPGRIE